MSANPKLSNVKPPKIKVISNQKDDQTEELKDLILSQMRFKKESHYLELGETGLTKNLSKTGG